MKMDSFDGKLKETYMEDTDSDKNMETEDEVVFEADVYLSQTLSESLHLFHCPTNNKNFVSDEDLEYLSARIKPKQKKLEMEVAINTHTNSYDKSRGEQMAYNVDGQNPSGEPYFHSSRMDKVSLIGSKADISNESYVVGFIRNGALHITPLNTVMEIRPGFVHMDKMDNATKKAQNPDEDEVEEEAVAVTVRFEGPNAERDRQIRQKSFQYLQQKNASEPWLNVKYHKLGSNRSRMEREKLLCSHMDRNVITESISSKDYLKMLVPESCRLSGCSKEEVSKFKNLLQEVNLSDQIKQLLINANVLTFPKLMEKLPPGTSEDDVLQRLPQFAVLVRGCWAVKSELLYSEDSVSQYSGIDAKLLINTRDYVMWLFNKTNTNKPHKESKFLTRNDILKVIYVPDDDLKSIISAMAVKSYRGWEFKFPYDEEFVKDHPEQERSQEMKWGLRFQSLVKQLGDLESEGESPIKSSSSMFPRPRQKRLSRSSISEGDESGTDSSCAKDAKTKRSFVAKKRILSPTKSTVKSKAALGHSVHGLEPTYLDSSPPIRVKTELSEFVGETLRSRFCMTLSEIKGLVLDSHLSSTAERNDFERTLDEALCEYGAQKLKNKWPQNTVPESLYAFAKFGNKLDRYRAALLEVFSEIARVRTNFFVKKVEEEMREIVPESDCRTIFQEYCVYKSGYYYLKGTISPDP